jgi:mannosyltransferase OCH1-like enzyme
MDSQNRQNLLDEIKNNKDFLPPFSGDPLWCQSKDFFYNYYNINKLDGDKNLNALRMKSISIIEHNILNNLTSNINKLTHKIWLTSNENPCIPDEKMLNLLKKHYQELSDYKHYFWTNNLENANKIIKLLEIDGNIDIHIKNIDEFDNMYPKKYIDLFIRNKLYANAGDILRIIIVYKYGGLYCDMGFSFNKYINFLLNDFDIMFNGEDWEWCKGYISHNVIYAKEPKNLIFETMLNNLQNIKFIYKMMEIQKSFIHAIIEIVSPRFIMVYIASHYRDKNFLALNDNQFTFDRYQLNSHINGNCGSSILEEKVKEPKLLLDMKNIVDNIN